MENCTLTCGRSRIELDHVVVNLFGEENKRRDFRMKISNEKTIAIGENYTILYNCFCV